MSVTAQRLRDFLEGAGDAVLVEVVEALGSTPREAGAWMVVSAHDTLGTIGGGQLEFLCIERAREALVAGEGVAALDIPLGPEIGQCCGGRVSVSLTRNDAETAKMLRERAVREYAARTAVYIFGAGHVGNALGQAFALLPFRTLLVDNRAQEIAKVPEGIEARHVAVQEAVVRDAARGSVFVVLTHDHGLDFLIAHEALSRGDAAYVGMIGSKTKRATFKNWLSDMGYDVALMDGLTMPIGGADVDDKRPEVIAALTAAEIVRAVAACGGARG
ncbi:xanthine dehydrogenase accessory protein XdhC [Pelagibacterium limicola]|uniref:xanthine dehydrogenase accessory protein XdhC n=1 Tax=Pelagibacterium limicola TaxID=2791022 RepID=UPI0018B00A94|nr:xanthine dehydrogenase accessory protein XdhC [Pelagibacterium limicola]